jgi:hypothetical protein
MGVDSILAVVGVALGVFDFRHIMARIGISAALVALLVLLLVTIFN